MHKKGIIRIFGWFSWLVPVALFLVARPVSAHEAYVLPYNLFEHELSQPADLGLAFSALKNPANLRLTFVIGIATLVVLILWFFFQRTDRYRRLDQYLRQYEPIAPLFIRLAISLALLASAWTNSFLGPELRLIDLSFSPFIRILLFIISILIFFGWYTRLAAWLGVLLFLLATWKEGLYTGTYFNYLGEFLALGLFGTTLLALDRSQSKSKWQLYEPVIIRIFYGLALLYAAVTVKLLHPNLTIDVVNIYNLTRFHLLFPSDPLLITFGAGLVEAAIGLFIIFGFQTRLVVLISLFYITLSLLFFREAVWPHLMLYGVSFSLLINNGGPLTLDAYLDRKLRR